MSAHAAKNLYLAPVPESIVGPDVGAPEGRWSGDRGRETESAQAGVRSEGQLPQTDRDGLEPHWVAAIDTATD